MRFYHFLDLLLSLPVWFQFYWMSVEGGRSIIILVLCVISLPLAVRGHPCNDATPYPSLFPESVRRKLTTINSTKATRDHFFSGLRNYQNFSHLCSC